MAKHLGLTAVGWDYMIKNWWDRLLAAVLLTSITLGSGFVLFLIFRKIRKYWQGRHQISKLPAAVARYFVDLKSDNQHLYPERGPAKVPKSFGVFLGRFSKPPTPAEAQLLSQWDIIILDPLQQGVLDAVSSQTVSAHLLGRLDISSIAKFHSSSNSEEIIRSLKIVSQTLTTSFRRPQDVKSPFTGVLLTNWQQHFPPIIFNELIKYVSKLGISVYLESSPPTYLTEEECCIINFELVRGIVCRNGTILQDGDRRNYFQMTDLRRTQRALAAQAPPSGSTVMMWETIDDDVELRHAIVKRSFNWCRFNNTLSWIGPKAALTNVELARTKIVAGEPLGALMWLKDEQVSKSHNLWRLNDKIRRGPSSQDVIYDSLRSFVPNLKTKLSLLPPKEEDLSESQTIVNQYLKWAPRKDQTQKNPFSFSPLGQDYTGLGCFPLGIDCSSKDFKDLIEQQRHLQDLNMLKPVDVKELKRLTARLQYDQWHALFKALGSPSSTSRVTRAIKELMTLVAQCTGDNRDHLKVYTGLHSGFRASLDSQFWGLHDVHGSGITDIYISAKAYDLHGTILHTFLSSRGCTRAQCFIAETILSEQSGGLAKRWKLPPRFVHDIEQLTPTETILFLQRLAFSNCEEYSSIAARMRNVCEYQLMEVPSLAQLRALNSTAYLRGEISAEDLVRSRLSWYRERKCQHPEPSAAIALFKEIEVRFQEILMDRQSELLLKLEEVLRTILQKEQLDAGADLFALSVFCACRKLALSEVYLEILDRNPLPNAHADQAACYAEMFATGSGCEQYFDMTPNMLGKILSDRYFAYYKQHQPPVRDDGATELPTTYASKLVDLDPDSGPEQLPMYYQITFLGIFAVPAFIDILLLTTIGRGLYLTTFMSETEKNMATTALMLSLFLCGAVGSWIGQGGTYYLHSMAFPAMNLFVLTRFIAGTAVCLITGIIGLVIITVVRGIYPGIIFLLYFIILTTYLSMLATLAIYQLPGFMFQSGRMVIMTCIPILLISPILTLFIGHDIAVYICVLIVFLTALIFGARSVISVWCTWYLKIVCVSDIEVVDWYIKTRASYSDSKDMADIAATSLPRKALVEAVLRERDRRFWTKATTDKFVKKLSDGYFATHFLMTWYCKYTRSRMPLAYSPTWNLQCKAGIDTLREMQKGLKLHNAFVHWRHGGDEVWCGVLYFVIALMDKWVALLSGGSIVGLSAANSTTFRLAVGFGLASYLVSAVFLDGIAQPLWVNANKKRARPVSSLEDLRRVAIDDARARRTLYWKNLFKFIFLHVYGIAITAALMWSFEESRSAVIMYFAYMGAYTGLLWYQYNRVFTGSLVLKDLVVSAIIALVIGLVLHRSFPDFEFSSVIALACGTWTVALLSIRTAKVGWPRFNEDNDGKGKTITPIYHCSSTPAPNSKFSQTTLSELYQSVSALPKGSCHRLSPAEYPGVQIVKILMDENIKAKPRLVQDAFQSAKGLPHRTAELWKGGKIVVDLVPAAAPARLNLAHSGEMMRTVSETVGDTLHVFVFGLDLTDNAWTVDIRRNCKLIAEALIQVTAEAKFDFSHDHSTLAQMLAVNDKRSSELSLPQGVKRQLETSAADRAKVVKDGDKALLHYLLLGLDCDIDWDLLPESIRSFLLKRCRREPCQISNEQLGWVSSRFCKGNSLDISQYLARCDLGVKYTILVNSFTATQQLDYAYRDLPEPPDPYYDSFLSSGIPSSPMYPPSPGLPLSPRGFPTDLEKLIAGPLPANTDDSEKRLIHSIRIAFAKGLYSIRICMKFFVVSLVADPEFQRELNYLLAPKPWFIRWPVTCFLNSIWMFCKTLQQLILPLFLFHGREEVSGLYSNMKGMKTIMEKNRIVVESLNGPSTCFFKPQSDGSSQLYLYSGNHAQEPADTEKLTAINTYNSRLVLREREEYSKKKMTNSFTYDYTRDDQTQNPKVPIQRQSVSGGRHSHNDHLTRYNKRGYITSGSYIQDKNMVKFKYHYRRNAKFDDELLRAEYVMAHLTIKVSWCVPPPKYDAEQSEWYVPVQTQAEKLEQWLPNSTVTECTVTKGSEVYHSRWTYDHRSHPIIETTLNRVPVATPEMIQDDWFHVLTKPKHCSFLEEDVLLPFSSVKTSFLSRLLGSNIQTHRISTASARTHLWRSWKDSKEFDAVTARWLDELALRSDRILKPYWRARDMGRLKTAQAYLDAQADTVMARTDIDPDISSWTLLAYRISDMYTFGQGGDATINTRTQSTQMRDSDDTLHVLAMDTGTWPNEGGGVSACRRDMVNNLKSIRWHVLVENANDFGIPKFQIEKNVQSLTVLPLWGLDFLTPTHGVFQNHLDSAVQRRSYNTTDADIRKNFFPILTTLVKCARALHLTAAHLEDATRALVDLNAYFQSSRHWSDVWLSEIVKEKWRELWLCPDMENARPISEWLDAEHPTLLHLDTALDMWHRYLFIFSIPVPDKIPDVFQASHHFAGASYGVLCKVLRNCTLHVWDHCISWREVTVFLSSAMSFDSPFVCTSLMSLSRVTCTLILTYADVVLPCADFFNPGWEIELGTIEGTLAHRRTYARKIDPVVNGIANMERFTPVEKIKSKLPTVSMLSHVRFVKDIKNSILAADIIVNEWGFADYRLEIYGDMIKAPAYSVECQEIIAAKGLGKHVLLKGLGSPDKVLEDAWIFLNCSVSEGLPLAMGEAALKGVPVVCTDVGASFRVVTDPVTGERFSAVVAPNDSLSLAQAQIKVLALLDEWSRFADDEPGYKPKLPFRPTPEDAKQITKRMYTKTEQRMRLGMMGRANVLSSFSSDRYLREHEQMLWIGKHRSRSYIDRSLNSTAYNSSRITSKTPGLVGWRSSNGTSQTHLLEKGGG